MPTFVERSEIEQLLLRDDFRELIPVLRRNHLDERRLHEAKNRLNQMQTCAGRLLIPWASKRFDVFCTKMDFFCILMKSRAEHLLATQPSQPYWRRSIDDLLRVTRAVSFYDSDVKQRVQIQISYLIDQLVKRRVSHVVRDLFSHWDQDGYLSPFSVDWGIDTQRFLDSYDGAVICDNLTRNDLEHLANEVVVLIGRKTEPRRGDDFCAICADFLGEAGNGTVYCHCLHGDIACGQLYHEACMREWVTECKARYQLPTCPSCQGFWISRRPRPGFF